MPHELEIVGGSGPEQAIEEMEMESVEIETETPMLPYPHFYELLALQEGVRMFRVATPADLAGFSDNEVLRMIRATCGDGKPSANLVDRIDAEYRAILRALNAVGEPVHEALAGHSAKGAV